MKYIHGVSGWKMFLVLLNKICIINIIIIIITLNVINRRRQKPTAQQQLFFTD